VRPIPPLRAAVAAVTGTGLAVIGVGWLFGTHLPRDRADSAWSDPLFLVILVGLALAAIGAISSALASAVPGRERAARAGFRIGVLGLSFTLGSGLWGIARNAFAFALGDLSTYAACLASALALGLASCVVACVLIGRADMRRPNASAALAIAGSVALGAVAVHASCPAGDALHQLVAHASAPLIAATILTPLVSAALIYGARRGGRNAVG
jgi:hypothetical protein